MSLFTVEIFFTQRRFDRCGSSVVRSDAGRHMGTAVGEKLPRDDHKLPIHAVS